MRFLKLILLISLLSFSEVSFPGSSSAQGTITMLVVQPLTIQASAPMIFPSSSAGAEAFTVLPKDSQSAKFKIRGEPNAAFQIHLPETVELYLKDSQDPSGIIFITNFESLPQDVGALSESGEIVLSVGAKRNKLKQNQPIGNYVGNYTVDIIY